MVVSLVYYSDVLVTLKHHEIRQHSVGYSSPMWAHCSAVLLHIQSICTRCVNVFGKFEDLIHEAKAKAKDYRNCPRGSSRPRTCPRGFHHYVSYSTALTACSVRRAPSQLLPNTAWSFHFFHLDVKVTEWRFGPGQSAIPLCLRRTPWRG